VAFTGSLFAVPQPDKQVLPPNSSQPLVEIATVVYGLPSIVSVNGRVAVASASLPLSDVKPVRSSGLDSIHAPMDTVAPAGRASAAPRQSTSGITRASGPPRPRSPSRRFPQLMCPPSLLQLALHDAAGPRQEAAGVGEAGLAALSGRRVRDVEHDR